MKKLHPILISFFIIIWTTFFVLPGDVKAFEFKSGENITLSQSQPVIGNLGVAGSNVSIDSDVNGDLYCAGRSVTVNGDINGDIICAAQSLTVNGAVSGSIRAAGQNLIINSEVGRNVTVMGQDINIAKNAQVDGEVMAGAQSVKIDGLIGSFYGGGEDLSINAPVSGNVDAFSDNLIVGEGASVAGSLTYTGSKAATINPHSVIAGGVTRNAVSENQDRKNTAIGPRGHQIGWPKNNIGNLLIYGGLALLMVLISPKRTNQAIVIMKTHVWLAMGFGAAAFIIAPVVAVMLLFTIIGIPISLIIFMLVPLALLISRLVAAVAIGEIALKYFFRDLAPNPYWHALAGVVITWMVFGLPFIGPLLTMMGVAWSFGGWILTFNQKYNPVLTKSK
jgi:cytoskeletal protein CcmA (bactofilin family)